MKWVYNLLTYIARLFGGQCVQRHQQRVELNRDEDNSSSATTEVIDNGELHPTAALSQKEEIKHNEPVYIIATPPTPTGSPSSMSSHPSPQLSSSLPCMDILSEQFSLHSRSSVHENSFATPSTGTNLLDAPITQTQTQTYSALVQEIIEVQPYQNKRSQTNTAANNQSSKKQKLRRDSTNDPSEISESSEPGGLGVSDTSEASPDGVHNFAHAHTNEHMSLVNTAHIR